jgi:ubiquinone/menaquinone biosynthesis C-methylase UbiE
LNVVNGFAENLPFPSDSFDFATFITSICFIENPEKALNEAFRILRKDGEIIIAFIDRESRLGQILNKERESSKFYSVASFYSVSEIISMIKNNGFKTSEIFQTLTDIDTHLIEQPLKGFGKGSFVVIKAKKQ